MATRQVFIGLTTEGTTDIRFLEKIVERTFEEIAYDCFGDVEPVFRVLNVDKHGLSFVDYILRASQQGIDEMGMAILCVHTDADDVTIDGVMNNKMLPAQNVLLGAESERTCKILVPIIPVQMMESWMLADKDLLKHEIGTDLTDNELGINRNPESIADPKSVIEEAIRISRRNVVKRRRRDLKIGDIYMAVGQKVAIDKLLLLPSYQHFQNEVRNAYRKLHLL